MLQPTRKTAIVNGLRLGYLEWGSPALPPVVCVHGYTSSAQAFNALARHLQDRFHVLALDVRGHGESAWSPVGAYGYADQASDLAAFADRLGLDKFALIGTSMGGVIAMVYAAEHGERLSGLVINDVGPEAEPGTQRITQLVGSRPDDFATLEDAMDGVPPKWESKRFDLVWVFDDHRGQNVWTFAQVPELVMPGDSTKLIKDREV